MEKRCSRCKLIKPLDDFYGQKKAKDGKQSECKKCNSKRRKRWRTENLDHHKTYNRQFYKDNAEKMKQNSKDYYNTPEGKAVYKRKKAKYNKKYPDKHNAHSAVGRAVLEGRIPSAKKLNCVICGKGAEEYHHYKGYKKENRMDIVSLCRCCHQKIHCITKKSGDFSPLSFG